MTCTRPTRRLIAPALIAALLALGAPAAEAGTYTHHSCRNADGTNGSAEGWGATVNHSGTGALVQCQAHGQVSAYFTSGAGPWPGGTKAGVYYHAPADTKITALSYNRRGDFFGENGLGTNSGLIIRSLGVPSRQLEYGVPLYGAPNGVDGTLSFTDLNDDRFGAEVFCWGAVASCGQPHPHLVAPYLDIRGTRFTLRDTSAPTLEDPSGSLASSGPHAGLDSLHADGTDLGGGIYRTIVSVDGSVVSREIADANDGACADANPANSDAYEFNHPVPCKLSKRIDVSVDTRSLSEGSHHVVVKVEDAAGNATTVLDDDAFLVDNVPPPVNLVRPSISGSALQGQLLTADEGDWHGNGLAYGFQWLRCDNDGGSCSAIGIGTGRTYAVQSQDVGRRLLVRVTATNSEGSTDEDSLPTEPIQTPSSAPGDGGDRPTGGKAPGPGSGPAGGLPDRGAANGHGATDGAKLSAFTRNRQTRVKTRFGRTVELSGRLVNENGQPIRGAEIEVLGTLRRAAATSSRMGSVKTDPGGNYRYRLKATASRTVRFAYRSHANDRDFADTSDIEVLVTGAARMKASKRQLRNRQQVVFSGRLRGELPAKGIVVVLQAKVGKKWQTFAHTRTRRGGRFRKSYRFLRTYATQTYVFRARVLRDAAWAFEPGESNKVKVKVRG